MWCLKSGEYGNQKELNIRITEFIIIKSSSLFNNNDILIEIFQKKPKLASVHQLW